MKKKLVFLLAALCLLNYPRVFAIPAEGDFLPSLHKTVWGVQFNHILRRDFTKVQGKGSTAQCFIQTSYALTERFFIDGKIGLGNVSFERADGLDLDFPAGFAGGYGFRYLLYENADSGLKSIFGFQHISCHPLKDSVSDVNHRVIWDEWQGTWLLIKEWKKTSVYCGPQYSAAQLKYKVDDFRQRLKTKDSWGGLAGGNYRFTDNTSINVEFRFCDEVGVNFGINYKF